MPPTLQALERSIVILDTLAKAEGGLSLSELSQLTGLPESTVHRFLGVLVASELVVRIEEKHTPAYTIGPKTLYWAAAFRNKVNLPTLARSQMRRLHEVTGETVALTLGRPTHRFYITQIESPNPLRYSVDMGTPQPYHLGASGKAMLAFFGSERIEQYLRIHASPPSEEGADPDNEEWLGVYLDKLTLARKRGYAVSRGELVPGAASVAAPILNHDGEPVGAISIVAPASRLPEGREPEFAELILDAAANVSGILGFQSESEPKPALAQAREQPG